MKISRLSRLLYLFAMLLIFIPIGMVLITGIPFSKQNSGLILNLAIILIIISRMIYEVDLYRENKAIELSNIGIIIGLILILVWNLIR